jgi:hypothetical protein
MQSLDFLGIDCSKATIYIVGNHWLDEGIMQEAQTTYGFGDGVEKGKGRNSC